MDAPVYRHAESRATLLGLQFPTDFFVVVVTGYLWLSSCDRCPPSSP